MAASQHHVVVFRHSGVLATDQLVFIESVRILPTSPSHPGNHSIGIIYYHVEARGQPRQVTFPNRRDWSQTWAAQTGHRAIIARKRKLLQAHGSLQPCRIYLGRRKTVVPAAFPARLLVRLSCDHIRLMSRSSSWMILV